MAEEEKKTKQKRTCNKEVKKTLISKVAFDSIKTGIKKFKPIIEQAKQKGFNESDTSNIIYDFLWEALWYDKYSEITTEYKIKGQYCDYWLVINWKLEVLMEVKQIWIELNDNHLFQAISYAGNEGVKRVILTNLREWRLYYLTFGEKIEKQLMVNIEVLNEKSDNVVDKFQYIHKESIVKNLLEDLLVKKQALSEQNIKKVIFGDVIIKKIQSEIKTLTGVKITTEEVVSILKNYIKD